MAFGSIKEIIELCEKDHKDFYEVVMQDSIMDSGIDAEKQIARMTEMWEVMCRASEDYDRTRRSRSGLVGGCGGQMEDYIESGTGICDPFLLTVIAEALKMGEANACMGRIVAAPTAGSCGVMPAVFLALKKLRGTSDELIIKGLFVAAGIGQVIAERATLAGAAGGCQAEVGSAAAMTAGAVVYMRGGNAIAIDDAISATLKNMLGLVCDPVAGLVEIPCVKRNVSGAVNALAAAEMALAGIHSAIPADQVIDAMREVGDDMDLKYKETAMGGCALTEMARNLSELHTDQEY